MTTASQTMQGLASAKDLFALTKPRVMSLVIFTALCGLLAAPGTIHPVIGFTAILAISLGAGASAALNQWYEYDIDAIMKRTSQRPLPAGRMDRETALHFGIGLSVFSVLLMGVAVNWFSAIFLAFSIFFYAVVYTIWLKRSTPQNIVIGGAAGAFPPAIGWAAVTGDVTLMPVLLFAIIFFWTPPHFWALALFMNSDYSKAGVPMMPVVAGQRSTRNQIFAYSLILTAIAIAPFALGLAGSVYGVAAIALSLIFCLLSLQVARSKTTKPDEMAAEKRLFKFSILYLFALFAALVADRMIFS
ncbi:protoheme IX farnesyltransferase [Parasphingorhabdus flavimaris]|uniref:Protoheme IX farnesyltransferase n=1 Tax=Parasphingorhabdus flavimaris TaxID=266812 RepID=A0ABX2N456_9SPHN|nr:heme o synthase [Parasphingorhabdus flavimaris]NVD28449.1 protoheme IX farnesyltransferase [Parasphingorhabdus flavimaris]